MNPFSGVLTRHAARVRGILWAIAFLALPCISAFAGEELLVITETAPPSGIAFSPDGSKIAYAVGSGADCIVRVRDARTGDVLVSLPHSNGRGRVVFSPNGAWIAAPGQPARVWDAHTYEYLRVLPGDYDIVLSPNSRWMSIDLWISGQWLPFIIDAVTGEAIASLAAPAGSIAWTPDGNAILAYDRDSGTMGLWDVNTGARLWTLQPTTLPNGDPMSTALSHHGKYVLTGYIDSFYNPKLWSAETGAEIRTFCGRADGCFATLFSPDDSLVLTVSREDSSMKLWATETGEMLHIYAGPRPGQPRTMDGAYSPDGTRFATTDTETIRLWPVIIDHPCPYSGLFSDPATGQSRPLLGLFTEFSHALAAAATGLGWTYSTEYDLEHIEEVIAGTRQTPGDGIPDAYEAALVERVLSHHEMRCHECVMQQFIANRFLFHTDIYAVDYGWDLDFWVGDVCAALLGTSGDMQRTFDALVLDMSGGAHGLAHIADYKVFGVGCEFPSAGEPFAASGDLDGDGLTNLEEYNMVRDAGGTMDAFAIAATDPFNFWPGNPALPGPGPAGLTALAALLALLGTRASRGRTP